VATGQVQGVCGDTRTEEDFVRFIEHLIESNPGVDGALKPRIVGELRC
jgi:hypothetical protein